MSLKINHLPPAPKVKNEALGLIDRLPLETARLALRPFREQDADALFALQSDPRVTKWAGGAKNRTESSRSLRRIINRTDAAGFGPLALQLRSSGNVVGWCGIQLMPDTDVYEVIYALEVAQWGKGLALEASKRVIDEAFVLDKPRIDEIYAQVFPQNARSIAVLTRLGMKFVESKLDRRTQSFADVYVVPRNGILVASTQA